ncbi:nucleotidyltransferase family protein [Phaeodactylibacter luteus]|uniref:Nucleotidyltransferase domain-containing protein n=1 Tax=Phaeodactylibacter luteus TaxID=1564516 RepID=A0A5C6RQ09_9BACT|nr:nucleotidyltransferase domain-containing protein [Phaeodactylibacter luteus]TXB63740.1 nucleotidyltransferase domain-containing protein [Phaeodactylibacter luteus]
MTEQSKTAIQAYFKEQPVLKAWLFGSHAAGTATEGSDIDLLVILDHSKPIGLHFVQMILDLEDLLQRKVDLVPEESLSPYIRPYVEAQKQLIYERED